MNKKLIAIIIILGILVTGFFAFLIFKEKESKEVKTQIYNALQKKSSTQKKETEETRKEMVDSMTAPSDSSDDAENNSKETVPAPIDKTSKKSGAVDLNNPQEVENVVNSLSVQ